MSGNNKFYVIIIKESDQIYSNNTPAYTGSDGMDDGNTLCVSHMTLFSVQAL